MQNQCPVSIVAPRAADYLRLHSHIFVCDGPGSLTVGERAARQRAIESCADRMAGSKIYVQFEQTLMDAHKLGTYARDDDV